MGKAILWWLQTAVEIVGYTFGLLICGIPALAIALLGWMFTKKEKDELL